jgi:hypothetical protein
MLPPNGISYAKAAAGEDRGRALEIPSEFMADQRRRRVLPGMQIGTSWRCLEMQIATSEVGAMDGRRGRSLQRCGRAEPLLGPETRSWAPATPSEGSVRGQPHIRWLIWGRGR